MHRRLTLAGLGLAALAGGCAFNPPQPWERGQLARPEMQRTRRESIRTRQRLRLGLAARWRSRSRRGWLVADFRHRCC